MIKRFSGKNYNSFYILDTEFTFVFSDGTIYQYGAELIETQLFGQIDLKKFRTTDFINNAIFIFPIEAHSSDITFKLFESHDYNLNNLSYADIDSSDLTDSGIVYDSLVAEENTATTDYILLEFDITRLMNKCLKEGKDKVSFRIMNNTTASCMGRYPKYSGIYSEVVAGYFSIPSDDASKNDTISLNDLVTSRVDLKTRKLKFDLPIISTKTHQCDLSFSGCIKNSGLGHLGHFGMFNYEYLIRKDSSTEGCQPRYVITDYRGVETSYLLLLSEEIQNEYGISIDNTTAYFNINDYSYIIEDVNYITIHYNNGLELKHNSNPLL